MAGSRFFIRRERWLAVADLHFGYELSQRAAVGWSRCGGWQSITDRLLQLVADYQPEQLDHSRRSRARSDRGDRSAQASRKDPGALRTDRGGGQSRSTAARADSNYSSRGRPSEFYFHHGHCAAGPTDRSRSSGIIIRRERHGWSGLRLKCPAFVQQSRCWIMPAFSPWASGTHWAERCGEPRLAVHAEQRDPAGGTIRRLRRSTA